jgi:hypothetical protein
MRYICDAPSGKTWFRIETEAEAAAESDIMHHAIEKHFRREREAAVKSYQPGSTKFVEQEIGLKGHIQRTMPMFLTLRDGDGNPLASAMLPPGGRDDRNFRIIIVGYENGDPYPQNCAAIEALAGHLGLVLDRLRCFPYRRV